MAPATGDIILIWASSDEPRGEAHPPLSYFYGPLALGVDLLLWVAFNGFEVMKAIRVALWESKDGKCIVIRLYMSLHQQTVPTRPQPGRIPARKTKMVY